MAIFFETADVIEYVTIMALGGMLLALIISLIRNK